ncbi:sarcosine oxidase subunit gamma family protein [Streptomyces physcomitrii]|uniref:sarcosine oxidase subunit gamma n=1 Tax=Streptomyces physcomitrii TaxID=2724184 RepID=UPI00344A6F30
MTAESVPRHSPLAHAAEHFRTVTRLSGGALRLAEVPYLTQLTVRAEPGGPAVPGAERALGLPLPAEPNTLTRRGSRTALWMGPDEWLVLAPPEEAGGLEDRLREALADEESAAVADVSGQRTTVLVGGPASQELLARGCALDLHPRAFRGGCAQTTLAHAPVVLVARGAQKPGFWVLVRSSYAGHLGAWLLDAATEYTSVLVGEW